MKILKALLITLMLFSAAYADDAIQQDVSKLMEGMDTSAIDGTAKQGAGTTTDNGMIHFDFAYGSEAGIYGPMRFNLTKRNLKKLERKLAKDEKKLSSSGNMSLTVLVRIEMNRQLINKLKSHHNFKSGHGCIVYFDVAEIFEKANTDAEFNRTLVAAAARTLGDPALAKAAQTGDYSGITGTAIANSIGTNVRNSVQNSISSSVTQAVTQSVTGGSGNTATPTNAGGGNNPNRNNPTGNTP